MAVSFPSTVFLLVVVAFMLGIMGSAIDVGGNTLLLWHGGVGVTRNMNILHLMFGFGAFAGAGSRRSVGLIYWRSDHRLHSSGCARRNCWPLGLLWACGALDDN